MRVPKKAARKMGVRAVPPIQDTASERHGLYVMFRGYFNVTVVGTVFVVWFCSRLAGFAATIPGVEKSKALQIGNAYVSQVELHIA